MTEPFYGRAARTLENQYIRVDFLTEAGPRIVRMFLHGSTENLLAELPDVSFDAPYGVYNVLGGHRLWHSPEIRERTYVPDDSGVVVEEPSSSSKIDSVRLVAPVEAPTGIRKSMELTLLPDRPGLIVQHFLKNEGLWAVELSAWAITQMPLGGLAVHPQQVGPISDDGLLPNRNLVLWPYTRWEDARLQLHDELILINGEAIYPPVKIGYMNRAGWVGYLYQGVFFRKSFDPRPSQPYPDFGCNAEAYCNHQFMEVETVGPLTQLEPGQQLEHDETWELFPAQGVPLTIDGIRSFLKTI